jgi:hypothetical protein
MAKDPVAALNKTQGESETSAEGFQEQVSKEKPDMSKEDAQTAVEDILSQSGKCLPEDGCSQPTRPPK